MAISFRPGREIKFMDVEKLNQEMDSMSSLANCSVQEAAALSGPPTVRQWL